MNSSKYKKDYEFYLPRLLLIASISSIIWVSPLGTISAQDQYVVGVEAGDWAGYDDVSFEWSSNITGYEQSPFDTNMSWLSMEVLDVQNTNVTVQSTLIYKNGTEENIVDWGDMATGEGNLGIVIIPSNLNAGDEIPANITWLENVTGFNGEPLSLSINGTMARNYTGAEREINYLNISHTIVSENYSIGFFNMSSYWDKETGVLCEQSFAIAISFTVPNSTYYMNVSGMMRMTTTNMWPAIYRVNMHPHSFNVTIASNSTLSNFNFSSRNKKIGFNVSGPEGKGGYCNVTISKNLLRGEPWAISLNGSNHTASCSIIEHDTHTSFYIPYNHSTNEIGIIGTWAAAPRACIIATAAYGSEMAPEVVHMRYIRDDMIGSSGVGKILVDGWNTFYYSWSPPVANIIAESYLLRVSFRVLLVPLLWIIHSAGYSFITLARVNVDLASIMSFLLAALMSITIYLALPLYIVRAFTRVVKGISSGS